jgi:division protein CdvB (Snf7/Vps24/ESCRT-III family)|tara:strand:+ start:25363 stop:25584 length:222 start_codon:yes stop_codon:yes gene_type:complete
MNLIPVENQDGLFRDSTTGAIVNTNKNEFETYITNRKRLSSEKERVNSLEEKVDDLKSDLDQIKSMLRSIVNG